MAVQRVMLMTPRYPPESCGVGDYVFHLAKNLHARGENVGVVTRHAGVTRPDVVDLMELPMAGWRDLRATLSGIQAARPARIQLEYSPYGWSRWGFSFWLNALAVALRWRGVEFRLALHEVPLRPRQRWLFTPLSLVQWLHVWLLALAANQVMSNTADRIATLRRWLPWRREKIVYRPNAATILVQPISAEQRASLRRQRGVADGALVVCTFGMFQAGKNYESLIESVALARRSAELRLWLLGDLRSAGESQMQKLQATVGACRLDEVTWWSGMMDAAEVSAHLQAADIFVLPQADGHLTRSSAFMAAAAHGLAAIAVRRDATQKEFTHGQDVWLVERSDAQHFAEAIVKLAGDAGLRARLGAGLRGLYAANFDWARSVVAAGETPARADAVMAGETVQR